MLTDTDSQYIVVKSGIGEYEEKKSKFLAKTYYISSDDEVTDILETVRKKYYDARHNCYAYKIGKNGDNIKLSDDGEPSQTAGRPIMDIIGGRNIFNILIVVTRYFGGVKLGTGGLARAYSEAARRAIDNSEIAKTVTGCPYKISVDYSNGSIIENYFRKNDIYIEEISYTDNETFSTMIPDINVEQTRKDLMEILSTSEVPQAMAPVTYVIQDGSLRIL